MRLDKFLAHCRLGSRKEVRQMLSDHRISVNDAIETDSSHKIDPDKDTVFCDGQKIIYREFDYFILNKPQGYLSATVDDTEKTVLDLIEPQDVVKGLFPVGRLDKDTTGLLLLTNNGALGHELLSPKKHVTKKYEAIVRPPLPTDVIRQFLEGIKYGKITFKPASLVLLEELPEGIKVHVTITEGKYHQVKKMFRAVGSRVNSLKRIEMGPLKLPEDLSLGNYRRLSEKEEKQLVSSVD